MSLSNIMKIATDSVFRTSYTIDNGKKLRLAANTLVANTLVYGARQDFGRGTTEIEDFIALDENKKQDTFTAGTGTISMVALLKPEYENGQIVIGRGASADSDDNFVGARLNISFQDTIPADAGSLVSLPGESITLINPARIPQAYYIKLQDIASGNRYCRITVDDFTWQDQKMGALENGVKIHLAFKNGSYSLYNTNPSVDDHGAK